MMGKSRSFKYQIGKSYELNKVIYDVIYSSTKRDDVVKKAKGYDFPKIVKDGSAYALLIPVSPSMKMEAKFMDKNTPFAVALKKYADNYKKLRL